VSRFVEAELVFAHGTTDPVAEAAFLVCESLHLHPDQFENFANARVAAAEGKQILDLIARRVATRKPAAYLVNKIYMRGLPFYVDERTIVPRSFIGELLDAHFGGESEDEDAGGSLIDDPLAVEAVLDLCTGSGCLAILASRNFPNAQIDAVDISKGAIEVAARNVGDYGLEDRVRLHRGDLFAPLKGKRYDLIISNPPYVDAEGMAALPRECRAEPKLAFDGGPDGLDIIRRILHDAADHLTPQGGLLCEIGRGRGPLEAAFPQLPLLWLDTEESDGEVFWIAAADLA
jgi:ribosomal protein L3 glutamine methyltransferase